MGLNNVFFCAHYLYLGLAGVTSFFSWFSWSPSYFHFRVDNSFSWWKYCCHPGSGDFGYISVLFYRMLGKGVPSRLCLASSVFFCYIPL